MKASCNGEVMMNRMNKNSEIRFAVALVTVYIIGFVFINWFIGSREIDKTLASDNSMLICVMGIATLVCASLMPSKPLLIAPAALAGIFFGVGFDALTDRVLDRNLFPIEMVIWTAVSTPGIIVGSIAGGIVSGLIAKMQKKEPEKTLEPAPDGMSSKPAETGK